MCPGRGHWRLGECLVPKQKTVGSCPKPCAPCALYSMFFRGFWKRACLWLTWSCHLHYQRTEPSLMSKSLYFIRKQTDFPLTRLEPWRPLGAGGAEGVFLESHLE